MQKNCRLPLTALKNLNNRLACLRDNAINKYGANSKSGRINRAIDEMSAAIAEVTARVKAGVIFKACIVGKADRRCRSRKSLPNYNKVAAIAVRPNKK